MKLLHISVRKRIRDNHIYYLFSSGVALIGQRCYALYALYEFLIYVLIELQLIQFLI
jgi:hypothetical protein